MLFLKKLIFVPFFILVYLLFIHFADQYVQSPFRIFSLDQKDLLIDLYLIGFILLASLFFIIFASLASDWRIVLPVILTEAGLAWAISYPAAKLFWLFGTILALGISYLALTKKLSSYLTFHPYALFSPSIKLTSSLLVLITATALYWTAGQIIQEEGLQIPNSLLDFALKLSQFDQLQPLSSSSQLTLPSGQISFLKQNSNFLKQYGLDPKILDSFDAQKPHIQTQDLLKATIKSQLEQILKPYQQYIPLFIALMFFSIFSWTTSALSIIPSLLIWGMYWLLEKVGFITFTKEMRQVKKLMV